MSEKKSREFRNKIGLTNKAMKAIREKGDYQNINPVTKIVYFKDNMGVLVPQKVTRSQIVNRHKHYYRQQKKVQNG